MLKKMLKDIAVYGVSSILNGGLSIILLPYLARTLMPRDYGVMDLLITTFAFVNVVVPLEITQAIARFYPTLPINERSRCASTGLWFTALMYSAFLLIALIMIKPITVLLLGDKHYVKTMIFALVSMATYGLFYYLQNQLRWMLKVAHYTIASLIFISISAVFTVILTYFFNLRAEGFFVARIIASLIGCVLCWFFSKGLYKILIDKSVLRSMLAFSAPLVISSVGVFFSFYADRFIIRATLPLSDLGIYSVCARIASVFGCLMTVVSLAVTPLIYSCYQDPKTPGKIAMLFELIVYGMLLSVIFLLCFSKKILMMVGGGHYISGKYVLPMLSVSFIVAGLNSFAPGLWIANKTIKITLINIVSAILNIALCFFLIKIFGYAGAGIAILISSAFTLIVSIHYSQKYYPISYGWKKMGLAFGVAGFLSYLTVYF